MSRLRILRSLLLSACTCAALLAGAATVQAQQYEPPYDPSQPLDDGAQAPGRVARLAYLSGQVQFAPAGEDDWGSVDINRPMVIGDRLLTGDDGRAVLELGDASIRIDHGSAFDFLNLDQGTVQIELAQGSLNLAVHEMADGANFEVDTPTIAFVASTPGTYRIDDSPTGTGSMVTVFRGSGVVYGENGASRRVVAGTSYRFNDSTLASVDEHGLPQADDFDRFCETRDANYERYARAQREYVPPTMIGGQDLYQYGRWNAVPEYGNVWYPSSVPVGWAPYRYGHWAWIDPWGWTWVDNQPWGFAPFHYGRWVQIRNRWGWVPGPVDVRPVYAPALVAFVGGSGVSLSIGVGGSPVGWFPLGPRDVYVPWFQASRGYFTGVNITNIRNVYVNRVVINNFYDDYHHHRYDNIHRHNRYRYRNRPDAITMIPRKVFTNARPVHPAVLKLDRRQLQHIQVAVRPDVNPGKASLGLRAPAVRPAVLRDREAFARPVVARQAPPPRPVAFAARQKVIASQHGQPLTTGQMRNLRRTRGTESRNDRVKLVAGPIAKPVGARAIDTAGHPGATTARPAEVSVRGPSAHQRVAPRANQAAARPGHTPTVFRSSDTVRTIAAHPQPNRQPPPLRAGELRSARFRHSDRPAALPRAPVLRPANETPQHSPPAAERLPVVRPIERAPRSFANRSTQPQRRANIEATQRARVAQPIHEPVPPRVRAQPTPQRTRMQPVPEQRAFPRQERARGSQVQHSRATQMQARPAMRAPPTGRRAQPAPMQSLERVPVAEPPAIQRPPQRQAPQPRSRTAAQHREPSQARKHPDSSTDKIKIR